MSDAILNIVVNANGVPEASEGLSNLTERAKRAETTAKSLTGTMGLLSGALGALGISMGLMGISNAADEWSDLNSRLGLAVGGTDKAAAAMERLRMVAKNTYSDIGSTTESFIANAEVLRALGKSTSQALDYTESLNNALVVSGAKADHARSVQEALSRAMALGKLSGDNLNTVLQKGSEVTASLAKEMGVSVLEVRKLGQEGKITGDVLYNALTNRMEELRDMAEEMPATWQDAATGWSNAFTIIIGTIDQATGASGGMAQALYDLSTAAADQAGTIAQAFVTMQILIGNATSAVTSAFGGMFGDFDSGSALMIAGVGLATSAFVGLAATITGPVLAAFKSLTIAVMANPLGLMIGAFAAVVTAAYLFRDEVTEILGVNIVEEAKNSANVVIGAFVAAYKIVVKYWENLPQAFSIIGKKAWNALLDELSPEKNYIESDGIFGKWKIPLGFDLSGMKADIDESVTSISADLDSIWNTETQKNWVGDVTGGLKSVWKSAGDVVNQFKDMNAALDGDGGVPAGGGALGEAAKDKKKKGGKDEKSRAAEKLAREMDQRLETLKEAYRSEEELQIAKYEKDLETLQWHLDQKKITEEEYNEWRERVTREHEAAMQQIRAAGFVDSLNATGDFFGALAGVMSSGNDKMLRVQKVFSAAAALVNAYLAASQALADPTIPFWGKFAAVAAVLAKGMSLVAAIKSGSGSAGGGGGSAAGNAQVASGQQKEPLRQVAQITLQGGDNFTKEQVIGLIDSINDLGKDGYVIDLRTD